jgi:hypothetical protein
MVWFGLVYGVYRHFHNYVSYIIASALLVEETIIPGETTDLSQAIDTFYAIMLYQVHLTTNRVRTQFSRFTECTGSCKFSYNAITTMTTPDRNEKAEKCSCGVSE